MTADEQKRATPDEPTRRNHRRWSQVAVVSIALVVAAVIALTRPPVDSKSTPASGFDMLAFLDERVAVQEDTRDVRCWSSFNKLQMFITQCEISEDAKVERIEQHMRLIDALWDAGQARSGHSASIGQAAMSTVLAERFPHIDTREGILSGIGATEGQDLGLTESLKDYSDTIEPWRLLQTWAIHQTDTEGHFAKQTQFDEDALHLLYRFFRSYDLAVLRQARDIAFDEKKAVIDKASLAAAFDRSSTPAP